MVIANIPATEAKAHIIKTLQYLSNNIDELISKKKSKVELLTGQSNDLRAAHIRLRSQNSEKWDAIIPNIEIPIENTDLLKHEPTVLINGLVQAENNIIIHSSISLSLIFKTQPSTGQSTDDHLLFNTNSRACCLPTCVDMKRVVRRFHFDYQPTESNKPFAHIQYGGDFASHSPYEKFHYCLEHFLEPPRIHHIPMDLSLLIDMTIREFFTPLKKWTQEGNWNNIVLEGQDLWWKGYYTWIMDCLTRGNNKRTIFQEIYEHESF